MPIGAERSMKSRILKCNATASKAETGPQAKRMRTPAATYSSALQPPPTYRLPSANFIYVGGAGGNGMKFKAYYSTSPDFPVGEHNTTNFLWQTSMTSNKAYYVSTVPVVTITDGETLYVRLYPYYGSAASGKTFCLKT